MGVEWTHRYDDLGAGAGAGPRDRPASSEYSVHNAVRGEAWTEFLLYANGFTVDEVRLAVRTFNSHLGRDTAEDEIRATADYAALRGVLERHELPAPRS